MNCQVSVRRDLMLLLLKTKALAGNLLFWREEYLARKRFQLFLYTKDVISANFRPAMPKMLILLLTDFTS